MSIRLSNLNIDVGSGDGLEVKIFVVLKLTYLASTASRGVQMRHVSHIYLSCLHNVDSENISCFMSYSLLTTPPQKFQNQERAKVPVNCVPQGPSAMISPEPISQDRGHLPDKELVF